MSRLNQNSFKFIYIGLAVVVLVAMLGYAWYNVNHKILSADTHEESHTGHADEAKSEVHEGEETEPAKGPHGGKLFRDGQFALEVKIFETGVDPQLRLYAYDQNKPISPNQFSANVVVKRLDAQEQLNFKPEADYLLADQVIYEPHSFEMFIKASYASKTHDLKWTQFEGRLKLADASIKSSGLELLKVTTHPFQGQLEVAGEVQIPMDKQVAVVARTAGVVVKVNKSLGSTVQAGDVLAVLESRDLLSLRATQRTAQQQLALAKNTLSREERLWKEKVSPEQDYLQAKTNYAETAIRFDEATRMIKSLGGDSANQADSKIYVRAPISGTVIDSRAVAGQSVSAESVLFQIANTAEMIAVVNVPEQFVSQVKMGMSASIQSQDVTTNDSKIIGQVSYVSALLGNETRTSPAHIRFKNPSQQWRQGQLVKVHIATGTSRTHLAVRADALQPYRDWTVVYIRVGDQFEIRPIEVGQSSDGYAKVLSGLKEGQVYAAGNSYLLTAELGKASASHDH
jgi:membrane fusion protein, heavy metal efflux system